MLQRIWPNAREGRPEDILTILDADADEELLAIMARDGASPVHYESGYYLDGGEWWDNYRKRNPLPWREYAELIRQKHEEKRARNQARWEEAQRRRELAKQKQREDYERRKAERAERDAEYAQQVAAHHQAIRDEWVAMFQQAIFECQQHPRYTRLLPNLLRDVAMIVDAPPGPLPWRLDKTIFWHTFAQLKADIDQSYAGHVRQPRRKDAAPDNAGSRKRTAPPAR